VLGHRVDLPQFNVNFATFLLLAIGEDGVVVLLQAGFHAVEAIELKETGAHKLLASFVRAQADIGRVELGEVFGDRLLRSSIRKIA
jgi:hypothetical protein